jgi:hypothetical protein
MVEKYKRRRMLSIIAIILGIGTFAGSFGIQIVIERFEVFLIIGFFGLMLLLVGIASFRFNRQDYREKLRSSDQENRDLTRAEMRLSDLEIKKLMKESSILDLEEFEKRKNVKFNFIYISKSDLPKDVICMISKTQINEKNPTLQCPNCQNVFVKKYLLAWLFKNEKCPICQFVLKESKKISE